MKRKFLKVLSVLACLTLAVGFASCGGEEDSLNDDGNGEQGKVTDGLEFTINSEGTAYSVTGIGVYQNNDIVIPNEFEGLPVTSIGSEAFTNCDNITSVEIPSSVTLIKASAFSGCSSLTGVYITDMAAWCNILFENPEANPLSCAKSLYLNDKLVTELEIPNTITRIRSYAFYNCDNLTSVVIPDGVSLIEFSVFHNCDNLTSVEIPDSIKSIGEKAFYGCSSLTDIRFGGGVEAFGLLAFGGCDSLTNIYATDIAAWCETLGLSNLMSYGESKKLYLDGDLVTTLEIPDTVTQIEPYAFKNCSITNVEIPDSVVSIGSYAFMGCDSITSVVIPDSVASIGDYAFDSCTSLTNVILGESLTEIGFSAFEDCYKLIEVYNKSSLQITAGSKDYDYAGYYAKNVYTPTSGEKKISTTDNGYILYTDNEEVLLMGYTGEENELELPSSVTRIYEYTFYGCTDLTSVVIPDSVTSIGESAFYYCDSLASVVIPDSVTSIGNGAFQSCNSLTIYCEAESKPRDWVGGWIDNTRSVYWYSETQPTDEGNYWHYGENGEIVVW